MSQNSRRCPSCGSTDYRFRGRKQIVLESGQNALTETEFRCQPCEHEWKERHEEQAK
jgi:hypothetical protein